MYTIKKAMAVIKKIKRIAGLYILSFNFKKIKRIYSWPRDG